METETHRCRVTSNTENVQRKELIRMNILTAEVGFNVTLNYKHSRQAENGNTRTIPNENHTTIHVSLPNTSVEVNSKNTQYTKQLTERASNFEIDHLEPSQKTLKRGRLKKAKFNPIAKIQGMLNSGTLQTLTIDERYSCFKKKRE